MILICACNVWFYFPTLVLTWHSMTQIFQPSRTGLFFFFLYLGDHDNLRGGKLSHHKSLDCREIGRQTIRINQTLLGWISAPLLYSHAVPSSFFIKEAPAFIIVLRWGAGQDISLRGSPATIDARFGASFLWVYISFNCGRTILIISNLTGN